MEDKIKLLGLSMMVLGGVILVSSGLIVDASSSPEPQSYLTVEVSQGNQENITVVPYSNMSDSQKQVFETQINNSSITAIPENTDNQFWIENRYVRYQNTTYTVAVAEN